jgi:hypothetical protein
MKFAIYLTQALSLVLILGCSSKDNFSNRLLYETGQNYDREQCQKNPTVECKNRKSYEQYLKEREEILKRDNTIQEVAANKQILEPCPYPAAPINWILRYSAFENQTGDEIVLQKSECFEKAQTDLNSKDNSCQIKEKYKLKYCEAVVKKHRTHQTVKLCLEDHSVKPFFAGN